jgi:hypothetical protein
MLLKQLQPLQPNSAIRTVDAAAELPNPYFIDNDLGSYVRNSSIAVRFRPRSSYCSASSSMGKAFRGNSSSEVEFQPFEKFLRILLNS